MNQKNLCPGCGVVLQTNEPAGQGFIVPTAQKRTGAICQRCYRLRHYGKAMSCETVDGEQAICAALQTPDCMVVQVIDFLDVAGSWIPGLADLLEGRPLWLVANKWDLLPTRTFPERACRILRASARAQGLQPLAITPCSAQTGQGMDRLRRDLAAYRNLCVIGTTNVGKSTWINRLLSADDPLTVSPYPGTTLAGVPLPWGKRGVLWDTPGIVREDRLSEWLPAQEAAAIVPSRPLRSRIYHLTTGQSLFLGGLLRFDVCEGVRQPYEVFTPLPVHRTQIKKATSLWSRHHGELLSPPARSVTEGLVWQTHSFTMAGGERQDLVVSGLGWITGGYAPSILSLWAPQEIYVHQRPALVGRLHVEQK